MPEMTTPPGLPAVSLAPSLICCDLCNIERDLRLLEVLGAERLHVDFIDGRFSPSIPIGIETIRQARAITKLPFDLHLMTVENERFIAELAAFSMQSICFHIESSLHVDRLVTLVKRAGAQVGIALMPTTPVSLLEYCLERIDFVLLMLINPGYACEPQEEQIPYAEKKIKDCRRYLSARGVHIPIVVDGRISFANIPHLVAAGADTVVTGSRSVFASSAPVAENFDRTRQAAALGLSMRTGN